MGVLRGPHSTQEESMQPLSFQPYKEEIDSVPIATHNKVVAQLAATEDELMRCRQKVAHLLKEKEASAP